MKRTAIKKKLRRLARQVQRRQPTAAGRRWDGPFDPIADMRASRSRGWGEPAQPTPRADMRQIIADMRNRGRAIALPFVAEIAFLN